jgi:hypothetical protein
MKKTLYFEGAGWSGADISQRTIGNCRIRTGFTNNEGRKIYLEITGYEKSANDKKIDRYSEYQVGEAIGFVDYCFYIDTESKDPCNECRIKDIEHNAKFAYTKEGITEFINKNLKCSFETIEVLPDLGGYRVHGDNKTYSMMEDYNHNSELIKTREEVYNHFYGLEKSEGKQYPNFSLWVDDKDIHLLHLLRHFNGYNKHWSIHTDIENWKETITETKLGKYAC